VRRCLHAGRACLGAASAGCGWGLLPLLRWRPNAPCEIGARGCLCADPEPIFKCCARAGIATGAGTTTTETASGGPTATGGAAAQTTQHAVRQAQAPVTLGHAGFRGCPRRAQQGMEGQCYTTRFHRVLRAKGVGGFVQGLRPQAGARRSLRQTGGKAAARARPLTSARAARRTNPEQHAAEGACCWAASRRTRPAMKCCDS
jgi:hypothetical protein